MSSEKSPQPGPFVLRKSVWFETLGRFSGELTTHYENKLTVCATKIWLKLITC
jgi:hypothetical protein